MLSSYVSLLSYGVCSSCSWNTHPSIQVRNIYCSCAASCLNVWYHLSAKIGSVLPASTFSHSYTYLFAFLFSFELVAVCLLWSSLPYLSYLSYVFLCSFINRHGRVKCHRCLRPKGPVLEGRSTQVCGSTYDLIHHIYFSFCFITIYTNDRIKDGFYFKRSVFMSVYMWLSPHWVDLNLRCYLYMCSSRCVDGDHNRSTCIWRWTGITSVFYHNAIVMMLSGMYHLALQYVPDCGLVATADMNLSVLFRWTILSSSMSCSYLL